MKAAGRNDELGTTKSRTNERRGKQVGVVKEWWAMVGGVGRLGCGAGRKKREGWMSRTKREGKRRGGLGSGGERSQSVGGVRGDIDGVTEHKGFFNEPEPASWRHV